MPFKFNISEKSGKTFHFEGEAEGLEGKEIGQKISGQEINPDLAGYEFEITGGTDLGGLPMLSQVDGFARARVLLGYGKGMHGKSRKEGKKFRSNMSPPGMRRRKTVRGKVLSEAVSQVNLKVLKNGAKKLEEIYPDQCKPKEKKEAPAAA
ncbi:30S ribosomal protein S6e [uncultured archaeon]|nr:30S ribosomal protein S6e [uncultured archaeon]